MIDLSLPNLIVTAIIVLVTFKLYRFWTLSYFEHGTDDKIFNPKIFDVNATYEQGTFLNPYPNLWYPIIQTKDLKSGQVKPLYVLEKNLVVYRTLSGKAYVLDAFCPHVGAHLGVGGSVVGEDIRCPFHNWTFNGSGDCTGVPELDTSNIPKARVKSWKCLEMNGWVYFWYHDKDQEPLWKPREFLEIKDCQHSGEIKTLINGHLMELVGNTSDLDHFDPIHSMAGIIPAEQVLQKGKLYHLIRKFMYFDYQVQWSHGEGQTKYLSYTRATIIPVLFGYRLTSLTIYLDTTLSPPVFQITTSLSKFNARFHLVTTMTPIAPMRSYSYHNFYHGHDFKSKLFARIAYNSIQSSLGPDQLIFNNKKILVNPHFTPLDRMQVKYIRWFKQHFYSL